MDLPVAQVLEIRLLLVPVLALLSGKILLSSCSQENSEGICSYTERCSPACINSPLVSPVLLKLHKGGCTEMRICLSLFFDQGWQTSL